MGARTHGDEVVREVKAELTADLVDAGKVRPHLVRVEMRQVEIDAGMLRFFHTADDSPRHHVAHGQFTAGLLPT